MFNAELLQKEFAVEKENTISTTTSRYTLIYILCSHFIHSYQTSTLEPAEERLTQQQIHVLIIGAGIAGITCALHLSKCAGLRVTIVEARNVIFRILSYCSLLNRELEVEFIRSERKFQRLQR
jgi:hypothetical protein